ncbi:hypothetical protein D3C83_147200 [compost metagenome]
MVVVVAILVDAHQQPAVFHHHLFYADVLAKQSHHVKAQRDVFRLQERGLGSVCRGVKGRYLV